MSQDYDDLLSAALSLPPGPRAMLAENLLLSLDAEDQQRIDSIWAEEVERRVRAIDEGKVKLIPGEEVLSELHSRTKS